ncbi:MAG: hypothetical protein CME71_10710 [Halobacteriovorax sp.]|nr:hypothetical protein [Halobacteriovorax sp.]
MINQATKDEFKRHLGQTRFGYGAYAVIDFESEQYETYQLIRHQHESNLKIWFDLASVTKALTLAGAWLAKPEIFTNEMILLLEHRAGLPFWGRLSKDSWKQTVSQYTPIESETEYSDFSALRLSLEIQEKVGDLYSVTDAYRDSEVKFWKQLPEHAFSPVTGWRKGKLISGEVHDDNCFVIGEKVGHAGLFGTIEGLSKTLLNYNRELGLISKMTPLLKAKHSRFVRGFDTVQNLETTLAGPGCSELTFGHTGFTGTSFWIDTAKNKGWILLTNGSYPYWYDRLKLNALRRSLGQFSWL